MKESKPIITILVLIITTTFFGCSKDGANEEASPVEPEINNSISLNIKDVSKWVGSTNYMAEDNRVQYSNNPLIPTINYRNSDDCIYLPKFSTANTLAGIDRERGLQLLYKPKDKTLFFGYWFKNGGLNYMSNERKETFKVLDIRIEDKDSETLGALILTLEATNKTDKLEVMFIDKGIKGLVDSDKCLVQISGQQSDLSTKPNEKNFYLCFSTMQSFKIVGKNIVVY